MSASKLDIFNYLLTFTSVILGLGITCLLDGVSKLIQSRKIMKVYWVHLTWAIIIALLQLELWWSQWRFLPKVSEWTLLPFSVHILSITTLFLASDLIFPNELIDDTGKIDFKEYYYFNIKNWIFSLLCLYLIMAAG